MAKINKTIELTLSQDEESVIKKLTGNLNVKELKAAGLSEDQVKIAQSIYNLLTSEDEE